MPSNLLFGYLGNRVQLLSQKRGGIKGVSLSLPKIRRNKLIEIIPINSGLVVYTNAQHVLIIHCGSNE